MIVQRNYSPVVALKGAVDGRATDVVGTVSGLRREISMIGGRHIVSYGADLGFRRSRTDLSADAAECQLSEHSVYFRGRNFGPPIEPPRQHCHESADEVLHDKFTANRIRDLLG